MYKYMSGNFFTKDRVYVKKILSETDTAEDIHTHDFIEMVYILSGTGAHSINSVTYNVRKGDLLFINYGETHSFTVGKGGMTFYNILIRPEFFSENLLNSENAFELLSLTSFSELSPLVNRECPFVSLKGEDIKRFETLLVLLTEEFEGERSGRKTMLASLMTALMTYTFRAMSPDIAQKHVTDDILRYIEEHYHEKISLRDLAERSFYTPSYFSRLFKDTYSVTLTDFLIRTRIEKSCSLLSTTSLSVEEVCASVGYTDKTKFYRHFKEITRKTPAEYRREISKRSKVETK